MGGGEPNEVTRPTLREGRQAPLAGKNNVPSTYATPHGATPPTSCTATLTMCAPHIQMWKVGEGNFGEVFRALLTEPQMPPTPVAVKTLKDAQTKVDVADEFFSEATILSQFNDQNVLGLIGIVTATSPSMLLLEFCDFGDVKCLLDKGRTVNAELRQEEFFLLVYQVCPASVATLRPYFVVLA
jgi:hypothetical protein